MEGFSRDTLPDSDQNELLSFLQQNSGPSDRTNFTWSGFPDHRTGPRLIGPEFRTIGPDQLYLVRNSGPPDRTNFTWSGIPDHRTGPKLNWSGIPDHGPDRTKSGPAVRTSMFIIVNMFSSTVAGSVDASVTSFLNPVAHVQVWVTSSSIKCLLTRTSMELP